MATLGRPQTACCADEGCLDLVAGRMAATIAAVCIAVGLPALLWFSSHSVKRTFHSGTALECPCGAAARPYRLIVSRPRLMARRGTNTPGSRPQRRAGELAQGGNRMRNQPEASGCFRRMISLELWLTAHQPSVRWVVHQVAKLGRRVFTPPGVPRFVAYFRVSTEKQGSRGSVSMPSAKR